MSHNGLSKDSRCNLRPTEFKHFSFTCFSRIYSHSTCPLWCSHVKWAMLYPIGKMGGFKGERFTSPYPSVSLPLCNGSSETCTNYFASACPKRKAAVLFPQEGFQRTKLCCGIQQVPHQCGCITTWGVVLNWAVPTLLKTHSTFRM